MKAKDAIRAMVQDSELNQSQVAVSMGRSESYIRSCVSYGRIPSIALMAEIGKATGHDLILRNKRTGNEIVIDPPE